MIRRYCDHTEDYEDILQETYIRVYKSIDTLQDEGKAQAWINKIAANTAIRHNMKKRPTLFTDMGDEEGNIPDIKDENENIDPEAVTDHKAVTEIIRQVLSTLPEDQRDALWMVYGQGITIKEMAENLGISENTIKSRLFQGRKKLAAKKEEFRRLGINISVIPVSILVSIAFKKRCMRIRWRRQEWQEAPLALARRRPRREMGQLLAGQPRREHRWERLRLGQGLRRERLQQAARPQRERQSRQERAP